MWKQGLAALALSIGSAAMAAPVHYGFDTDAQAWFVIDGADLIHHASGGVSGGYLELRDSTSGDFRLGAPASLLGSLGAFLGGSLSFDAKNLSDEAADWSDFGRVTISGGGMTLSLDLVAPDNPPPDGGWHHFSIPLTLAAWGADLAAVLGSADGFDLKLEFHNGVSEWVGVDNIDFADAPGRVPEPALLGLSLAALGAAAACGRRRRG